MKKLKLISLWVVIIFLTSILFMVAGNMIGDAPETVSAAVPLTEDMIMLCIEVETYIGTEYVDYLAFLKCCHDISSA